MAVNHRGNPVDTLAPKYPDTSESATYTFASPPQAVHTRKKRTSKLPADRCSAYGHHKSDQGTNASNYGNLMYDRRVIRGNTYARPIQPPENPMAVAHKSIVKRRTITKNRASMLMADAYTPEPPEHKVNVQLQTELYLEELTAFIETVNHSTQTDVFMDQPNRHVFVPAKVGIDLAIQVEADELFDFDAEVTATLDVLIRKSIEMALMEVCEEEELANIRRQTHEFEVIRQADIVETQRMEEQQKRLMAEKDRRMKERLVVMAKEEDLARRIAAVAFGKCYMEDLVQGTFVKLFDHGYFYDEVCRDVEMGFLNNATQRAIMMAEDTAAVYCVLDELLFECIKDRNNKMKIAQMTAKWEEQETEPDTASEKASASVTFAEDTAEAPALPTPRVQIILPGDTAPGDDDTKA